jgi:hypothetical protein
MTIAPIAAAADMRKAWYWMDMVLKGMLAAE